MASNKVNSWRSCNVFKAHSFIINTFLYLHIATFFLVQRHNFLSSTRSKFIVTIQIPSRDWTQNEKDVQPEWRPVCLACTIDLMWEGLLGNGVLINQLSRRTAPTYSQFARFHCVNISTTAEFMIPTWGHWTRKECAQLALAGRTSWLRTPLARPWYVFKWDGRCLCWHIYESLVKISSGSSAQKCRHRSGNVWICHTHRCFFEEPDIVTLGALCILVFFQLPSLAHSSCSTHAAWKNAAVLIDVPSTYFHLRPLAPSFRF